MDKEKEKEILNALDKIAAKMEVSGFMDYIEDSRRPLIIIWRNLLAGVARGVGITLGATFVVAVIIKIISYLIKLNIPYLTEMLKEIVLMIKNVN